MAKARRLHRFRLNHIGHFYINRQNVLRQAQDERQVVDSVRGEPVEP